MALQDVDTDVPRARGEAAARAQRVVTHLALDPAGDGAAAARAHALRAQLAENQLHCVVTACVVLRGKWPPHGAVCGG